MSDELEKYGKEYLKSRFENFLSHALKARAVNTEKVLRVLSSLATNSMNEQLKNKILGREEVGYTKYGVTMDRKDYTRHDWLLHLLEELLDCAQYAMAVDEVELCKNLLSDAIEVQQKIDRLV